MKTNFASRNGGYSAIELIIGSALMAIILGGAFAGAAWARDKAGLGPVFMYPGTEQAAQQLVRDNFADVSKVGKPVVVGNRMVDMTATIAGKDCKVKLYSAPDKLENDYGFTVKHMNCAGPAL